jgi:hypothetical protein
MAGPQPWKRTGTAIVPARLRAGNWEYRKTNQYELRLRSDVADLDNTPVPIIIGRTL